MKRIASKIKEGLPHKREKNLCDSPLAYTAQFDTMQRCLVVRCAINTQDSGPISRNRLSQALKHSVSIHPADDAAAVDFNIQFQDRSQRFDNVVVLTKCTFLDLQPFLFLILVIYKHQVVGAGQMDDRTINSLGHVKIIGLIAQNKAVNILPADFSTGTVTIESLGMMQMSSFFISVISLVVLSVWIIPQKLQMLHY